MDYTCSVCKANSSFKPTVSYPEIHILDTRVYLPNYISLQQVVILLEYISSICVLLVSLWRIILLPQSVESTATSAICSHLYLQSQKDNMMPNKQGNDLILFAYLASVQIDKEKGEGVSKLGWALSYSFYYFLFLFDFKLLSKECFSLCQDSCNSSSNTL